VSLTKDHLRRIAQVAHARHLGFVDLVGLAELDPATAFRGAVLRGDLRGQDLSGFDFTGAEFCGCDLTGADLSRTEGVTPKMLADAITDETTILPRPLFWANGQVPSWAEDWGRDEYGPWVTFRVPGTDIAQRMRWCPPGSFMMGSPDDEPMRYDDEGPRHHVTFEQGYWMFDTVVTEALWFAVTGRDPEKPRGAGYPVTQVNWHDARDFIQRLNTLLLGLSISLPSEACWEYACRAKTETRYSFGAQVTKQQVCFGSKAPVPVARFSPNPWGLYEMHGNFWEWCADHWHPNYDGAPCDERVWLASGSEGAAYRVMRGGSWNSGVRYVRAAYRFRRDPMDCSDRFSFRCVRVQTATGSPHAVETAEPASWTGAERVRPQGTPGAAAARNGVRTGRCTTPDWTTAAGQDEFGDFAVITVPGTAVTQRLRWIPPGRFRMGSPEDEPGRYENEGPLHDVTLARGFWLFDTPVTQALWDAVMGSKPSRFQSPTRPVETVSFDDAMAFIDTLNDRIPGLELSLPSEAQWEYACRAGTRTATYAGKITVLGARNASELDAIAWYAGNSGDAFELDNRYHSSHWSEKQYGHLKAGMQPVALKASNLWGLFDMLGSVQEWCRDHWHRNYDGAPVDGSAWLGDVDAIGTDSAVRTIGAVSTADAITAVSAHADRVLRGGCWYDSARGVRAAYRFHRDPTVRDAGIGFRCIGVQHDNGTE
jgi:formylglycine-generating enzyme required for sulfatase activity